MGTEAKIQLGRRLKAAFYRLRLHRIVRPFSGFLKKLAYLSDLSQWIHSSSPFPYSDAANRRHAAEKRFDLYRHVLESEELGGPIDYLEFGVGLGRWFRWWVENNRDPDSQFIGFDTFTGLPESWDVYEEGAFSVGGKIPDIDDPRCRFEAGLFQDTLEPFLEKEPLRGRLVVHIDADLYSSTLYVLTRLAPRLKPGDVLLFDELGVPTHEFRAFTDFVSAYRVKTTPLGAVNNFLQVALRVE